NHEIVALKVPFFCRSIRWSTNPILPAKTALSSFPHRTTQDHLHGFRLNAAINLARLGETQLLGERVPPGVARAAGRGAMQETEPAPASTPAAGDAAGWEASTPHQHTLGKTGTASPQGEAA
ncbi:MAG: hypothetical protein Q8P61_00105, partial [Candidatus Nanopelagicales bacterium]|nr:hypothetical protein [Candidatus Nanopelagicales bacterium]